MSSGFAFRYQFTGYVSDEVLARMVGQLVNVTGVRLGDDELPVPLGQYRVAGVTRVTETPAQDGLDTTVAMIHMQLIEEQQGTAPSGEETDHAQDPPPPPD